MFSDWAIHAHQVPVYCESVAISDAQFRLGVVAAGVVLVVGITAVRFCGSMSLPPKPSGIGPQGNSSDLLKKSVASPAVYQQFLEKDAASAGVRPPTVEEMSRKFPYRVDEARHVLEVGQPAIEIAGLKLTARHSGDAILLQIENATSSDLAYAVTTVPAPNISSCNQARPLSFNALVVAKGQSETRVECVWREGMALVVTRVETMELPPLSAWYVSLIPPRILGGDERVLGGHRKPAFQEKCGTQVSQAVRSGLDKGQIGWRDLIDFYARHRCPTYQFPASYRAFKMDDERAVPAVAAGM